MKFIALVGSLFCGALAYSGTAANEFPQLDSGLHSEITNVTTMAEADLFARNLIDSHRNDLNKEIFVYHVGNALPDPVKWIIVHLAKAGFEVRIDNINADEIAKRVETLKGQDPTRFTLLDSKDAGVISAADQRISDALRHLFGMPNGFTFWVTLQRTTKQKLQEAAGATAMAAISGVNVAASLAVIGLTGVDVDYIAPTLGMMAWVWWNLYHARAIAEWMSQGREVIETPHGAWVVAKSPTFNRIAVYLRSTIANVIFVLGGLGVEQATSWSGASTILGNAFVTLFSRFWVEEWLANHQASTLKDGTVVVLPGQHRPVTTIILRNTFEFLNSLFKSLSLAHVPVVKWVFPGMGAVGLVKTGLNKYRLRVMRKEQNQADPSKNLNSAATCRVLLQWGSS